MISAARLVSNSIARSSVVPMAVTALGATRSLSISDTYGKKEKVEEDRYIRARESELRDAKAKAAMADTKAKELEAESAEQVAAKTAAMNEVADMLAATGDVVSEAGLANLADWKHC
eukprot:CAMPEP_0181119498 /NCGR_PEP_ID=MMETSP1071-20121207/23636_1 /TAXON_ID=35127 /ORGANISM="Thalassiosira sp., Strain NH16" /LENGTH=116 /DNA_ID=CAMNT_0023204053 /DNA_START=97 /DNA_END=447 /DNA_ORIENTATION=+